MADSAKKPKKRSDAEIIAELRSLLNEVAFAGERVIFGRIFKWRCRMCGETNSNHEYYCPVGKILKETEATDGR